MGGPLVLPHGDLLRGDYCTVTFVGGSGITAAGGGVEPVPEEEALWLLEKVHAVICCCANMPPVPPVKPT